MQRGSRIRRACQLIMQILQGYRSEEVQGFIGRRQDEDRRNSLPRW
jgi:hypothetical protein